MIHSQVSRRGFSGGPRGGGAAAVLGGCATAPTAGGGGSDSLVLQSSLSDAAPKAALTKIVQGYGKAKVTLNTIAIESFRAQLPTYLNSGNPPDVLTWYAGSVARDYAKKGFLLDVSDLWKGNGPLANYSPALRELSSAADGKQIFVPTSYYWWGIFYRKSAFAKWGVRPATSWTEFIALCHTLKSKGVNPLTMGTGSTPWVASGWFDYLNLRVNGATFHRDLLAGKHSFDGPEVRKVMDYYKQLLPFFDPKGRVIFLAGCRHPFGEPERRDVFDRCFRDPVGAQEPRRRHRLLPGADHRSGRADRRGGAHRRVLRQCEVAECQRRQGFAVVPRVAGQPGDLYQAVQLVEPAHLAAGEYDRILPARTKRCPVAHWREGDHPVLQP
nr:ABC transporter substrate-binding protein [Fodinicola feengrottensis]